MGYDGGDSFPFDFEPNGIPFGSKSTGKLSLPSYPNQYERNWKYSFLSEATVDRGGNYTKFGFKEARCPHYAERRSLSDSKYSVENVCVTIYIIILFIYVLFFIVI